jgi:hypothetical protein
MVKCCAFSSGCGIPSQASGTPVTAITATTGENTVNGSTVTPVTAVRRKGKLSKWIPSKELLTLTFSMLWVADAITTAAFVNKHGLEMEANPIVRWVMEQWSVGGLFMFKFVVLAFWISVAQKAHWGIHVALNVIMAVVVYMGIIVARS